MMLRLLRRQRPLGSLLHLPQHAAQACTPPTRRLLHDIPILRYQDRLITDGVHALLSPDGFELSWTQYQSLLIEKLNEVVASGPYKDSDLASTVIMTARQPEYAATFNYASMAYNNHFFFSCLNSSEPSSTPIPNSLASRIADSFSSVETLRAEMINTAEAMFGPGFVWLVEVKNLPNSRGSISDRQANLRLLTTYSAGSPLSAAHYRRQPTDLNTSAAPASGSLTSEDYVRQNTIQSVGAFGSFASHEQRKSITPGGAEIVPLLCVNTWQHVWLRDWGIRGKRGFLEAWWDRIDWDQVHTHAGAGIQSAQGKQNFAKAQSNLY